MGLMGRVEQDEYLEQLWYMKERGQSSVAFLKRVMKDAFDEAKFGELVSLGLVEVAADGKTVKMTDKGEARTVQLIRAHRLAERLITDVLGGGDLEPVACEFEHTVSLELVNGICTLLGHPRECPHGMPIPEGDCCREARTMEKSFVIPLTDLGIGETARIAYINARTDQQIHKLDGLCVRPGIVVKLHQDRPVYVIECEGASIALDTAVAKQISVWRNMETGQGRVAVVPVIKKNPVGMFRRFLDSLFGKI